MSRDTGGVAVRILEREYVIAASGEQREAVLGLQGRVEALDQTCVSPDEAAPSALLDGASLVVFGR